MSGSVGGIDASIPLQAKAPTPQNPLQQIGEFAQAKNALNSLQLFPGQQQRQQQEIALGDQAVQGGKIDLQTRISQAAHGAMVPILASPPGTITHDALTSMAASVEKNLGLPTHDVLQNLIDNPMGDGPAFDAFVRARIAAGAQPYAAAAGQVVSQPGALVDQGPNIQPTVVAPAGSPNAGRVTPAGPAFSKGIGPQFVQTGAGAVPTNNGAATGTPPIENQLSPAQLATPTQIGTTPDGAPIMGTLRQFLDKTGGQSPLGTGRFPAALRGPNAPASPAEGVVTGVGPAKEAQLTAQGGGSAKAFSDYADQGVQARGQAAVLGNMLGDVAAFTPGPEKYNDFLKTLQRYTPRIASAFGVDPKSVAANESFDKLAAQIAGAQGERSDARLAVAQNANPGSHLSPAGADLIIRQLQGNADYLQARSNLASKYPDQTDRAGFETDVGSKLDPRAFQFERMTPSQKIDYVKGLSPQDKKAVQSSYNYAVQGGLFGGGNAQ